MLGIGNKSSLTHINGQVAGKMQHQKNTEKKAGNRHHQLFSYGTPEGIGEPIHFILRYVERVMALTTAEQNRFNFFF